ncbi:MAG TPA: ATP-binding cassette domain-containing protein [Candidatus Elarobacter sp.]
MGSLVLSGVARSFGNVTAVRDVSFEVPAGTTFGLLGPNGAGKTTTMRMILGILPPDRGTVTWNGAPIDLHVRRRFGYLPEERGLYAKVKVRDHIAYFGRLHGVEPPDDKAGADQWIERLGLGEYANRRCGELSKGNQQKVQIACAALHHPELLILDEPFSGLDPVNAETLLDALRALREAGTTLILSSHQMWQIEDLCERFCIIAHGTVRASGTLTELRSGWPTRVVKVEPPSPALRAVIDAVPGARELPSPERLLVYEVPVSTDSASLLRALVAADAVTRFERVEPRLADIYVRATENAE